MASTVITLQRTKNRRYEAIGGGRLRVRQPAEYGIFRAGVKLAAIVFNGDGWRACTPTAGSRFGTPISPIGMDKFKAVRKWSFEYFEKENEKTKT